MERLLMKLFLGYVLDPDYGDITHPETGTDLVLNYTIPGTPGSFPKTPLKPRRRPSILCDEAVADCDELIPINSGCRIHYSNVIVLKKYRLCWMNICPPMLPQKIDLTETQKYNTENKVDAAFKKFMNG